MCDIKIMYEPNCVNFFVNLHPIPAVQIFDVWYISDSLTYFDIWYISDSLTYFDILTLDLKLKPSQPIFCIPLQSFLFCI